MTEEQIRERYRRRIADEIMSVHNQDKSPLVIASSILSIKGIRIEAENQELPDPDCFGGKAYSESMVQDILKPDSEGRVLVWCLKKEERGS